MADKNTLIQPPYPVEQAIIIQAKLSAHAEWLSELYAAADILVNSVSYKPYKRYKRQPADNVQPAVTDSCRTKNSI